MLQMKWCVAVCRIKESSAAIQRCRESLDEELKTLLRFLDYDDVLVVYAAKEEILKVLLANKFDETQCVSGVVRAIISTSSTTWTREASGFRFQLLRQLITVNVWEEGGREEEENQSGRSAEHSYLQEVLKNLMLVGDVVRSVFVVSDLSEEAENAGPSNVRYSVQYEALVFLIELIRQLHSVEIADQYHVDLSKLMRILMDDVFVAMNYVLQPTFVSSAVLELLGDFHELLKIWKNQAKDDVYTCLEPVLIKWLKGCLVGLLQSSCTTAALRLLNDSNDTSKASQAAFVATSSRYPFLQQWLRCLSRIGATYLEALLTQRKSAGRDSLQLLTLTDGLRWLKKPLVCRQQLFNVLAEQDDVMIEVLNDLIQMTTLASNSSCLLTQCCPSFVAYVTAELDPDVLFADLVETLGRDHLVLLDLLVSNETQMLEYLTRYLRHLNMHWATSMTKLQACGRLECVMSVLIRLRLEIDRLVTAGIFPYDAGPLTRRMMAIEQLYENPHDDAEQ